MGMEDPFHSDRGRIYVSDSTELNTIYIFLLRHDKYIDTKMALLLVKKPECDIKDILIFMNLKRRRD